MSGHDDPKELLRLAGKRLAMIERGFLAERSGIGLVSGSLVLPRAPIPAAFLATGEAMGETVIKVDEGRPNIADRMKDGRIDLVMSTTEGAQAVEASRSMRNVALTGGIPYFTTLAASHAAALAMKAREEGEIEVRALQGGKCASRRLVIWAPFASLLESHCRSRRRRGTPHRRE